MAKRTNKNLMTQREFKSLWRTLPEPDRRFFRNMIIIQDTMGLKGVHYRLLPPALTQCLLGCDRDLLFSILADCVGLLTDAPAMKRVQDIHRGRANAEKRHVDANSRRQGTR